MECQTCGRKGTDATKANPICGDCDAGNSLESYLSDQQKMECVRDYFIIPKVEWDELYPPARKLLEQSGCSVEEQLYTLCSTFFYR